LAVDTGRSVACIAVSVCRLSGADDCEMAATAGPRDAIRRFRRDRDQKNVLDLMQTTAPFVQVYLDYVRLRKPRWTILFAEGKEK